MSTKPVVLRSDLRVVYEVLDKEGRNVRDMIGREASVADLVAALIAEGGEIDDAWEIEDQFGGPYLNVDKPGRYLVYGPIPVEEETTT